MKASISTWSFPFSMSLEDKLKLAREAGFEGFELDYTEDGAIRPESTPAELQEVRALVESHGLEISGLATGVYWGANPLSADPKNRKWAAYLLERQLEAAAGLGVDTILVVPGAVAVDFIPNSEIVPYGDAYLRAREFVASAVPRAEELGVTIGIENVWNKFLTSPREMAEFIDSFKSQHVGAYFDVGNVLALGYPEHWISLLAHRIKRVHFKDWRRAVGTTDGFVDLLAGDVNWPGVMASFKEIGYDSWCAAEMIPPVPFYKHAPEVLIHNTHRAMQAIFAM